MSGVSEAKHWWSEQRKSVWTVFSYVKLPIKIKLYE